MIRLQTYAVLSLLATTAAAYLAFSTRGQFYPAMAHLSSSKPCLVLLLNTGLVAMCAAWQLAMRAFLGPLREAKAERLNEQAWREAVEVLFAITIFRQEFSVTFLVMVAALLLVKALHWLAQKRVEYIETTPSVPVQAHARIVSFMAFASSCGTRSARSFTSGRHLLQSSFPLNPTSPSCEAWVACSCYVGSELVGPAYATGWSVWLASRGGGPGSFGAAFVVCGWSPW